MHSKPVQVYQHDSHHFECLQYEVKDIVEQDFVKNLPKDKVTWLNFHSIDDHKSIEAFCKLQHFDTLVVSDIFDLDSRPKFEDYGSYFFFTIRSAIPQDLYENQLMLDQISFILGENYVISFQVKSNDHFISVRDRIENKKGIIRDKQADFLLYRLLDAIIDNYFEVLDDIETNIDYLESLVNNKKHDTVPQQIDVQKRRLTLLRKVIFPIKELAIGIENSNSHLIHKDNRHFFMDFKNNCLSILEEIEFNRNSLEGISSLYYASQGQRMNQIMKLLTIVSTIFIPLTFIVGVYGMNFHNMPELEMRNGYFICLSFLAFIAIALILYFYRKGWLSKNDF